jgi:hypothetical protein
MTDNSNPGSKFAPVSAAGANAVADDAKSPAKVMIGSLDDKSLNVTAQFNPKELDVGRNVPWSKTNEANKSNSKKKDNAQGGIHMEFTGAEGRSLTLELLFDSYEDPSGAKANVEEKIETLEKLASVREPSATKEELKRPHRCVLVWGKVLPRFECVIQSLNVKYTMFSKEGVPLRATAVLKLAEANIVSLAKKK